MTRPKTQGLKGFENILPLLAMRTLRSFLLLGALTVLLASAVFAEDADLAKSKSAFDRSLRKIQTEHANNLRTWPARYVKALIVIQKKMQTSGNLDEWQMADAEIKRFKSERTLTELDIAGESAKIEALQREHLEIRDKYEISRSREVLALRDRYVDHLMALQKRRTQAGKIEAALRVKEAIEHVNLSEAVTSAEFAAADEATRNEPDTSPGPEARTERPERVRQVAQSARSGITIHPAGKIPPSPKGAVFKRKSLTRSDHSPLGTKIAITYWEHSSNSTPKGAQEKHSVRLGLRSSGLNAPGGDIRVQIQHYLKPVRSAPQLFTTAGTTLPALQSRMIHVDFPPVSPRRVVRGSSSRSYRSIASGKYYGCIITIQNAAGKLLYQGSSIPQLKDLARALP